MIVRYLSTDSFFVLAWTRVWFHAKRHLEQACIWTCSNDNGKVWPAYTWLCQRPQLFHRPMNQPCWIGVFHRSSFVFKVVSFWSRNAFLPCRSTSMRFKRSRAQGFHFRISRRSSYAEWALHESVTSTHYSGCWWRSSCSRNKRCKCAAHS